MTPNQEALSERDQFLAGLARAWWLFHDLKQAVEAGGQLERVEQRLDELGDLMADFRGLTNSAKAANIQSAGPPGPADVAAIAGNQADHGIETNASKESPAAKAWATRRAKGGGG